MNDQRVLDYEPPPPAPSLLSRGLRITGTLLCALAAIPAGLTLWRGLRGFWLAIESGSADRDGQVVGNVLLVLLGGGICWFSVRWSYILLRSFHKPVENDPLLTRDPTSDSGGKGDRL